MSFQCKVGHLQLQAVKLLQSNFQEKAHVAWGFHLGSGSQILLPWPVRFCFLSLDFWVCYLKKQTKKTQNHYSLAYVFRLFLSFQKATYFFFLFISYSSYSIFLISCFLRTLMQTWKYCSQQMIFFEPSRFPLLVVFEFTSRKILSFHLFLEFI